MRRGFTLIELLLVISIIATLAALLLPSIATARSMAISTACQSQARQMGIGVLGYAADYRDRLPGDTWNGTGGYGEIWPQRLREYIDDGSDLKKAAAFFADPGMVRQYPQVNWYDSHYAFSKEFCSSWDQGSSSLIFEGVSLTRIVNPSVKPIIFCGTTLRVLSAFHVSINDFRLRDPHRGKASLVYADFHVGRGEINKFPLLGNDPFWNPGK